MEKRAKLTSKGQITVPLEFRRLLGVKAGDDLVFESTDTGVSVRPLRKESPFAKYQGIGNPGIGSGRKAIVKYVRELRGW
jgi:AbrB family looped-hinge helix DNA binding protein